MWSALRRALADRISGLNWPLVIIAAGFILFVPLYRIWLGPLTWLGRQFNPKPFARYEEAVRDAAVKTPDYVKSRPLATIGPGDTDVEVSAFKIRPPRSPLPDDLWVALPGELKQACAGSDAPALRLEQILGLPPSSEPRLVYRMTVKSNAVFRPCMSSPDPTVTSCSLSLPKAPELGAAKDETQLSAEQLLANYNSLRRAYDHLRFVASQLWTSYQIGFPQDYPIKAGDYPYKGLPFTGMGWTYDWGSASPVHFGVTEFIVRKDATISVNQAVNAATFCKP